MTGTDETDGAGAAEPSGVRWVKSARSGAHGNCVELADLGPRVGMRNSRHPDGPVLHFPAAAVRDLLAAVRAGEFDDLLGDPAD